ncbi:hypothetical protein WMY93_015563 [Mugilogobius chulae]|uniref:C-C motif chemokine n=1 Tax=Mugilogobius chulae TaxID=88201 RepID=A0AAW0P1G9_9GOBI
MAKLMILLLAVTFVCCVSVCTSQNYIPDKCCFSFRRKPLPQTAVAKYVWTSSHCARTGVIFTMKLGLEKCVDPTENWVKKIMRFIDSKRI